MTLKEFFNLLKAQITRIVAICVVSTLVFGIGAKVISLINPSYTAISTVVTAGGTFASVTGLGESVAAEASQNGAKVTAKATSSNTTVTFTVEAGSADAAVSVANEAASNLAETAKSQEVAKNANISQATSASPSGKSALFYALVGLVGSLFCAVVFYVIRDSQKGCVHSAQALSNCGLTYLGCLDGNDTSTRFGIANFHFSNKNKGELSQRVLLQPTSSKVNIKLVESILGDSAKEAGIILRVAPALRDSVYTLYKAESADTVIVVVEENVSTLSEVEEIVREFKIANVHCGGFIYLPQFNKQIKSSKKRSASGSHGNHTN